MPTPEVPIDQHIVEHPTEVVSETLSNAGIQSTPANVTQVNDDHGQPLISTPATQSAKIQIPGDTNTWVSWSKGSINNAVTWLGKILLMFKKKQNANNNNTN